MMKKLTVSIIMLSLSATAAFSQLGTSEQKNWGLGLKLGDPTGFTAKKYFANNGALEFVIGIPTNYNAYDYDTYYYDKHHQLGYHDYKYNNRGAIAFQLHYLHHFDIPPVEGLQWYIGGGLQVRNYFYETDYYDNNGIYHSESANYLAAGIDLTGGAEYTFRGFPATVFVETNFFLAVVDQAGFYFQPAIGGRFNIK